MNCAVDYTIKHIKNLAPHMAGYDVSRVTLALMMELGLPEKCCGFEYLRTAILAAYEDPTCTLLDGVYEIVIQKHEIIKDNISTDQVESAIRTALEDGWKYRDMTLWRFYFPDSIQPEIKRPSNTEFIFGMAKIVELCMGHVNACEQVRDKEVSYATK